VIINTCGFIQDAVDESFETIENLSKLKESGKIKKIVVTGCLVHRLKNRISEKFPQVDLVVGIDREPELPRLIKNLLKGKPRDVENLRQLRPSNWIYSGDNPRLLLTPLYAYVKVSEGCNRRCAFCIIPRMRGKYRSRRIEDILKEVRSLVHIGVKEIILIAQDLTLYGYDLYSKPRLDELIKAINDVEGVELIRLMYLHPSSINRQLIKAIEESDKVARYLHVPVQHASDRILKLMKRAGGAKSVRRAFELVRTYLPEFFIRTEVIVGFPGEKPGDVEELIDFLYQYRPERIALFPYSDEPEAASYKLPDKVSQEETAYRLVEVSVNANEIMREVQEKLVGKVIKVVMDSENEGHSEFDAPEIDFTVHLRNPADGIVRAKITDITDEGDLKGVKI